jgi:DNA-directed RNA polymerase specialized sigma24 family protein
MLGVRVPAVAAASAADDAVTTLYAAHYRSLVRLAALLAGDARVAEQIVQDSFAALHGTWHRLHAAGADAALAYLRRSVVSRSRQPRRRRVQDTSPAAEPGPQDAVIAAIRALPPRQREALVLRFYLELSDRQIAEAMGLSTGLAASYAAQGMLAMQASL